MRAHPGNVIVDLFAGEDDPRADLAARRFCAGARALSRKPRRARTRTRAFLMHDRRAHRARSPASRRVDVDCAAARSGNVCCRAFAPTAGRSSNVAIRACRSSLRRNGRVYARAWRGSIGPLLARAQLVMGQAGTANEARGGRGCTGGRFRATIAIARPRGIGCVSTVCSVKHSRVFTRRSYTSCSRREAALLDDAPRRARMGAAGPRADGRPRRRACRSPTRSGWNGYGEAVRSASGYRLALPVAWASITVFFRASLRSPTLRFRASRSCRCRLHSSCLRPWSYW